MHSLNNTPKSPKKIIAAFDFDGTLTYRDTLLSFLFFVAGPVPAVFKLLQQLPQIALALLSRNSRQKIKECVLTQFLGKMPAEKAYQLGKQFASQKIAQHLKLAAMQRLKWHRDQGHHCILISANLNLFLKPWGANSGFHEIITSECEVDPSGVLTGRLVGANCWGAEKFRRLSLSLGPRDDYILYAYGDSRGDKELLAAADYSFYRKWT